MRDYFAIERSNKIELILRLYMEKLIPSQKFIFEIFLIQPTNKQKYFRIGLQQREKDVSNLAKLIVAVKSTF
ncbi:hypothetical protein TTHERM_001008627 (macronuclear) [Tetrahymena thermophila SB210]|uniref:Uncharacterized protein n=1 Tax=Tetrahymena thermophila (strain SB210) TaxID=312017 RepID=W7XC25_TETTS|nr:hypothetical protein TTHERM_001008627 [Tetrahymena thermophila SB210]EWS71276.1 hypothetical protein TTHERM_001008627 [Tetrahymena thermophila SB210]|eukprot:XP_012656182.1 hypothetical protein TTHERM_001008627 [Tetrahymena thermophila SB210]